MIGLGTPNDAVGQNVIEITAHRSIPIGIGYHDTSRCHPGGGFERTFSFGLLRIKPPQHLARGNAANCDGGCRLRTRSLSVTAVPPPFSSAWGCIRQVQRFGGGSVENFPSCFRVTSALSETVSSADIHKSLPVFHLHLSCQLELKFIAQGKSDSGVPQVKRRDRRDRTTCGKSDIFLFQADRSVL